MMSREVPLYTEFDLSLTYSDLIHIFTGNPAIYNMAAHITWQRDGPTFWHIQTTFQNTPLIKIISKIHFFIIIIGFVIKTNTEKRICTI